MKDVQVVPEQHILSEFSSQVLVINPVNSALDPADQMMLKWAHDLAFLRS
jgi:hypothetical protein